MLFTYSWARHLPLSMVNTLNWEKTHFSFACEYKLQIAYWSGVGDFVQLLLSVLGANLTWTCAGTVHAATVIVNQYICYSYSVWETELPWCHQSPLAVKIFPLILSQRILSLEWRGWMKASHLGLGAPKSLNITLTI